MNLQHRIELLERLGQYISSNDAGWEAAKEKARQLNGWFIKEFTDLATKNIADRFLDRNILLKWVKDYSIPNENPNPKGIGIVMAGNIPLVGFHDLLTVFITGNRARIKVSSKDEELVKHLVDKLISWNADVSNYFSFETMLRDCDAYIATGSNNTSRYFEYYFGKYPHIIRRNRTSVGLLDGTETTAELDQLADDVHFYFGLGCRNVTKIYVPQGYDFIPLLKAFSKYGYLADLNKYKNNFDYNLAILILNKRFYMTNNSILLVEEKSPFSPISQLNYEFYSKKEDVLNELQKNNDIQCVVGHGQIPFGEAQSPEVSDYADGVDTLKFLLALT